MPGTVTSFLSILFHFILTTQQGSYSHHPNLTGMELNPREVTLGHTANRQQSRDPGLSDSQVQGHNHCMHGFPTNYPALSNQKEAFPFFIFFSVIVIARKLEVVGGGSKS